MKRWDFETVVDAVGLAFVVLAVLLCIGWSVYLTYGTIMDHVRGTGGRQSGINTPVCGTMPGSGGGA